MNPTAEKIDRRTREGRIASGESTRTSTRVPVGSVNKLEFEGKDPNFVYRVVNDVPGRIQMFQRAGYQFCTEESRTFDSVAETEAMDTRISMDIGGGRKGYLMRIPKEFYEEDFAKKMARLDAIDDSMKPKKRRPSDGEDGFYGDYTIKHE